ncbi:MAG: hypothetical protein WKF83_00725 [Nocardioidaceae bacterium]
MTSPLASSAAPFGRVLTAMVTPFAPGRVPRPRRRPGAARATSSTHGNDGLVLSGTTGESLDRPPPRRTAACSRAVVEAVGDRAACRRRRRHQRHPHSSVELARQAVTVGAHGLLHRHAVLQQAAAVRRSSAHFAARRRAPTTACR